jgi:hypothetical protein
MRILLVIDPVDFREGIDGLAGICRRLELDPFCGYPFVLGSRKKSAM